MRISLAKFKNIAEEATEWGFAVCLETDEDPNIPLHCSCSVSIVISKQEVNEENF